VKARAKIVINTTREKNLFWGIFSSRELIENGYPNGWESEFMPRSLLFGGDLLSFDQDRKPSALAR
jgi:hypothetical protein